MRGRLSGKRSAVRQPKLTQGTLFAINQRQDRSCEGAPTARFVVE
jgi:hypothetical protein